MISYEKQPLLDSRKLLQTGLLIGSIVLLFQQTDTPVEETFDNVIVEKIVEPTIHRFGLTGWWEDDNPDNLAPATNVGSGKLELRDYLTSFTTYVEAEATLSASINGATYSESHSVREGFVVNRLTLPGAPVADIKTSKNVMYITQLKDGVDVGIDTSQAQFEMLHPELAEDVNGALQCEKEPEDPGFAGCITKDSIRKGFWAAFPVIGEDQEGTIYNSAEILFDQFGKIEECHFDAILIPAFNKAYSDNKSKGIQFFIDGQQRYQQVMEILIRGSWRDSMKESRIPQSVFFNLNGQFEPAESINVRLQNLSDKIDFPFSPPKNLSPTYCAEGPEGTIPFGFSDESLTDLESQLAHIAIMGLPQVPDGYNPFTRSFEDGDEFKAPSQEEIKLVKGIA